MNKNSNYSQAIWLSISSLSSFLLAFVSAAILSRYFDKTEYGTYKQLIYVYATLQTIFTIGLPGVFSYFIPRYSIEQGKFLVNRINLIFVLLGLIFSFVLFFSSNLISLLLKNPELAIGLKIFSIFPLFTLPALGVEGLYTALRKTKYIAIYVTISRLIMLICIIIPVLLFNGDYKSAIIGWGVAAFLNFLYAMYMKNIPYINVNKEFIPNFYSTIFNYSVPLMGASIIGFFISSSNQFFISRYYGTVTFADFSNGFISLPLIGMVSGSVKAVLMPIFSKAQHTGNIDDSLRMYRTAVDSSMILVYPLILFCFAFAEDIVVFVYGTQYLMAASYFRVSLIRDLIDVLPFLAVLLATGHSKIYLHGHMVFALCLLSLSYGLAYIGVSPIYIVLLFVLLEIGMKMYFFLYIYKNERINLFPLSTFVSFFKIIIHISLLLILLSSFSNYTLRSVTPLISLTINILLLYILIFISQKLFNLNYYMPILQIIKHKI